MYFPKSQIKTNLYTNGEELVYKSNNESYIGYYWKTSKGQFFSGKTPQDTPIQELIIAPAEDDVNNTLSNLDVTLPTEITVQKLNLIPRIDDNLINNKIYVPTYSPNTPTQQDYQIGEFRRYFCKKTNEIIYLEISKNTYDKLINRNPQILYQLYFPFNIPWQLTGNKEQVYKTNKNLVDLTIFRKKLPMFQEYLQNDFTKYYK